ncbi:SNF2-related protein [Deltaproteobacteria bacterium TL4]
MDAFNKFRRKSFVLHQEKKSPEIFFQIHVDEIGAYLSIVDQKGQEVEANYRYYHGAARDILRAIENIQERNHFRIDWESSNDRTYLAANDFLLWHLRHCPSFVNAEFKPIKFCDEGAHLTLSIEEVEKNTLKCQIVLSSPQGALSNLFIITENHVLCDDTIYQIAPLNENFAELSSFETTLPKEDLENYLSICYSHFENIQVRYEDYEVIEGPQKVTQSALIFEQVDHERCLYLRISSSLEGLDADFFEQYEVNRLAMLNEMEHTIQVCSVVQESSYVCFKEIQGLLTKYKRLLKEEDEGDYFIEENLFIIQQKLAQDFIHKELPRLITKYALFGAEKLKSYKVQTATPKLNVSLGHGINFLEGDASLEIEGETFSLFDALTLYRKKNYIPLSDGSHALINQDYIEKLERLFKKQKNQVKVSFFDLPAIEELIDEKTAQATFAKSREIFQGFNELQHQQVQLPTVNATLRPYQKQGYKWLRYLHSHELGGCLADDMGLGKTLQAITLLSSIYPKEQKASLLVMPKSLIFNWQKELTRFNPELSYYVYYGNDRDLEAAKKHHLILTTYGMLRNAIEQFKEESFYYLILDESQNIKNVHSQVSKAVMLMEAKHRLALSGTPIENNLSELYALFRFLSPAMFGSYEEFNRYYLSPIQQHNDKDVIHELRKKIYPFILRRLKKEVLKDLPDKVEQTLYVEMSPEQKKLYEQRRAFYQESLKQQIAINGINKSQFYIFQALNELRQIASTPETQSENRILSPKRELLLEQILESTANKHKVLVFGNFLSIIEHVGEDLSAAGIEYLVMTGATRDRGSLVERFQTDPKCQVFLMTLKTGGLGLNLTKADTIFIYDPWWNLAAENQAIDRTHRIGQDKTVFSYKLITRGTIEEKIVLLQEKKRELFENIISSDSSSIKSLNEDDIDFILS